MPEKYTAYTTADFIADEAFQQWARFPDAASTAFWTNWLAMHPHKKAEVDEAAHFLQRMHLQEDHPSPQQVEFSLEKNLKNMMVREAALKNRNRSRRVWFSSLATAAVLCALVAVHYFYNQPPLTIEVATQDAERRTVLLPDSSTVTLNGKSQLRYLTDMRQRREVWLEGEGFFDVQH